MGKSTAAFMLKRMGIPVFDSDASVHKLTAAGGQAVGAIKKVFPSVATKKGIDRAAMGSIAYKDLAALRELETILHPMVQDDRYRFLLRHAMLNTTCVVLDAPLLFEAGINKICDAIFVVSAPFFLQRQRALSRTGMTEEKFMTILKRQLSDAEKRQRSDVIIHSGLGKHRTWAQLRSAARDVKDSRCGI